MSKLANLSLMFSNMGSGHTYVNPLRVIMHPTLVH